MATCDPWPVEWPCDITGRPPSQLDDAAEFAAFVLWGLTGRRLGVCDYVEGYWPTLTGDCGVWKDQTGVWRNGRYGSDCCRILLHNRPIVSIESVELGTDVVDPDGYDIVRAAWLRRRGGCWPTGSGCDDAPVTVAYRAGQALPPGAAMAVGEVACELLKGWAGEPCKLPSRAISVSRQGVTVQLADPQQYVDNGLLGLPVADAWVRACNPNRLMMPSRVYSPDLASHGPPPPPAPILLTRVLVRQAVAQGWTDQWAAYTVADGAKVADVPVTASTADDDLYLTLRLPVGSVEWVVTHAGQIVTGGVA